LIDEHTLPLFCLIYPSQYIIFKLKGIKANHIEPRFIQSFLSLYFSIKLNIICKGGSIDKNHFQSILPST
jgi:hypothetical protein